MTRSGEKPAINRNFTPPQVVMKQIWFGLVSDHIERCDNAVTVKRSSDRCRLSWAPASRWLRPQSRPLWLPVADNLPLWWVSAAVMCVRTRSRGGWRERHQSELESCPASRCHVPRTPSRPFTNPHAHPHTPSWQTHRNIGAGVLRIVGAGNNSNSSHFNSAIWS